MGFGKLLKGFGKKLTGKGPARAGYSRAGQKALLGGTTKSTASRAFGNVKARAKSLGSKVRGSMSKTSSKSGGGGGDKGFSNFDGPYKPSKDHGMDTTMDFDSVFPKASRGQRAKMSLDMAKGRARDMASDAKSRLNNYKSGGGKKPNKSSAPDDFDPTMSFESVFPKASRGQRAKMSLDMAKGRARDMASDAKSRLNNYKSGGGKKPNKSSAPDDFDPTMSFESVFPKASRGQRAKMSLDMAKGRARDMAASAKAKYNKYKQGKSAKAGMASNGNTRYDAL
jgi:flagellar basal body rod protein FlgB